MKRLIYLLCLLSLLAPIALADEIREDDVMGLYTGGFEAGDWAERTLEARVIARGETLWQAALYVGAPGAETVRVTVKGKRPADAPIAEFEGEVDLGAALGGIYQVQAAAENRVLTGAFSQGAKTAAFTLAYTLIEPPTLGAACPPDGVHLFDGTQLDAWVREPEKWCLTGDGAMEVCGSSLRTIEEFGSARLHVEFMTPFMPTAIAQGRGNSGVYVAGRYEVQVLDSFGEEPAWDYCGGIYKIAKPLVNATLPPLQWQTYDMEFQAPVFDGAGAKTANARVTIYHNGVLIHDDLELPDRTPGGMDGGEAPTGHLYLQDHGNQVRFRNIWIAPLD
jgi:hypothetical protein